MITELVKEAIQSRSMRISKKFKFLEFDDLYNDGIESILTILRSNPDVDEKYLLKAVNNKYSNVVRDASRRFKFETRKDNVYEMDIADQVSEDDLIKKIDNDRLLKVVGEKYDGDEYIIFNLMYREGYRPKEVANILGISRETVRRKINDVRKELRV